jgi:hypothetical protein
MLLRSDVANRRRGRKHSIRIQILEAGAETHLTTFTASRLFCDFEEGTWMSTRIGGIGASDVL